jgi:cytochrome c-type biogenesis protein CcmH/NrfF
VLWFGPFVLLLVALVLLGRYVQERRLQIKPQTLSDEERARAEQLLKG